MIGAERRFAFWGFTCKSALRLGTRAFSSLPGHPGRQLDWNGDDQRLRLRPGGRRAVAPACGVGPGLMYFSTQRPGPPCGRSTASCAASCGAWFLEWSIDPVWALRGVALGRGRFAFGGLPGAIRAPSRAAQRAASPKKALRLRFNLTGWSSRAPSLDVLPGSRVAVLEGYSAR